MKLMVLNQAFVNWLYENAISVEAVTILLKVDYHM